MQQTQSAPQPAPPPKPPGFVEKVSALITKIDKSLLKIQFLQKVPVIGRRLIIIFGLFYLFIIILFIVLALLIAIFNRPQTQFQPDISPLPRATLAPKENRNPSEYATDSEVLELERDINLHDNSLLGTEVSESVLNIPSLNFDVNF